MLNVTGVRELKAALRVLFLGANPDVAGRLTVVGLLVIVGGLLSGLAPLALKELVDTNSASPGTDSSAPLSAWFSTSSPATLALAYLLAICSARLLADLRPSILSAVEQSLYTHLRRRYFAHVLELPLGFHLSQRPGAVVQSLEQGISGYQLMVHHLINSTIPILVELASVTIVLATQVPPVLLSTFAGTAVAYLVVLSYGTRRIHGGGDAVCSAALEAHSLIADSLLNCESIKCFGAEATFQNRYADSTARLELRWRQLHCVRRRTSLAMTATFTVAMAACLAVALHAWNEGALSVGGFVLATVYLIQVVRPLEMLGAAARDLPQALSFLRPLLRMLNEPVEPFNAPAVQWRTSHASDGPMDSSGSALIAREQATVPTQARTVGASQSVATRSSNSRSAPSSNAQNPGPASISFFNVGFSYDDQKPVLQDVNLDIAPGSHTAIVGASGCGKSSLMRLFMRLYPPGSGRILLDGVSTDAMPLHHLRAAIGWVPQDTVLFNDTVAFNIGLGAPGVRQEDIEQAVHLAGLHDFIRRLPDGDRTVVGERGLKVSGGERQRIAIARALLKRPRIFVFDEATSMLDSATEQAVLQNLHSVSAGITTITIAHRLSTIRRADQIVALADGRVAEQGDHTTLLARGGIYARMWHAQHGADMEGGIGVVRPTFAVSRPGPHAHRPASRRRPS